MSASSRESSEIKFDNANETIRNVSSSYALYLFSNNKRASATDSVSSEPRKQNSSQNETKDLRQEEPSVCLSLLEGNLGAEQETIVRCYLLKILSVKEDLSFENEGKFVKLHNSNDEPFGCYYHKLSKYSASENTEIGYDKKAKPHTFFICLISPATEIMESFCPELGKFCHSLIPLLDPEGLKNKDDIQLKLKSWFYYCVEYIGRCIQQFKNNLSLLLLTSLWGNVDVNSDDETLKWDVTRFVETSCMMPADINSVKCSDSAENDCLAVSVTANGDITTNKSLGESPYCKKWLDKLTTSNVNNHAALHSILEAFRLKTIQDLNTLKRFLQKAQSDQYSLYRAYQFLQSSGYEDILLHHVRREARMAGEYETLEIISCLQDFMKSKHSSS